MPKHKVMKPRVFCLPSAKIRKDWSIDRAYDNGVLDPDSPIPSSKDLRGHWGMPKDQGRTSSCVGWATADLLHWHFSRAKLIDKRTRLSARYLWMAAKERDELWQWPTCFLEAEGTSIKAALHIARKFGVLTESTFRFKFRRLPSMPAADIYDLAGKLRIENFYRLSRERDRGKTWRRWLALQGPIIARVTPDSTWSSAKKPRGQLTEYTGMARTPHAVLVVGYDFSKRPAHFIIRNSEGRGWGDKGYGYASLAYVQEAIDDAYGIAL